MGMSWSKLAAICVGVCSCVSGALMLAVGPNMQSVICDLGRPCHLTCTHRLSGITDLNWVKNSGSYPRLYGDHGDGETFIHPDYRGKLSVSSYGESEHGLVSDLCLMEPGVHSESVYLSQARNHLDQFSHCFLNLTVKAPVTDIDIRRERNQIVCRSKKNYPKLQLEWLLDPSWENVNHSEVVQHDLDGLFSVQSFLDLPHSEEVDGNLAVSCVVSRDHEWKRGTWTQRNLLLSPGVDPWIHCIPDSNETLHSFTWTFHHEHLILSQNSSSDASLMVSDDWKENVKKVSAWGDLQLKAFSPRKAGLYSCVAEGLADTFFTDTILNVDQGHYMRLYWIPILVLVGGLLLLLLLWKIFKIIVGSRNNAGNMWCMREMDGDDDDDDDGDDDDMIVP
ncbi:uncharacterized protein LOC114453973 isoform X2 [Gouania willdenowi]|uniref:uncharacterized protein LOC114453973 isoform X2 n=1 Tax=Gouania willdenowi TaxID=441366 RepID=UPI0010556635|nr:uncharacterized protein LOC114453973 isoform X2 [Gouania willdenowi]